MTPIGLPRTGQTTSHRTGDDGGLEYGLRRYPTRAAEWIDMGDGTVLDRATGLFWVKQPSLIIPGAVGVHATNQIQGISGDWANAQVYAKAILAKDTVGSTYWVSAVAHLSATFPTTFAEDRAANPTYWRQTVWVSDAADPPTPAAVNWNTAIDNCLALEYAGRTDWRLPNIGELSSVVNHATTTPPNAYSPLVVAEAIHWTSTTRPATATYAFYVSFVYDRYLMSTQAKANAYNVLPCAGGCR